MYKLFTVATLATLATFVAAAPTYDPYGHHDTPVAKCNTGDVQCCNTVDNAHNKDIALLASLLGIVVQDANVPIGIQCNPIDVIGISGNSCTQQPVCCDENNFNGLVAVGCTPVNVNV
ncbi:hydrophobin 1 [Moniliophthora roreri MCA 2997]|uniref:Hydrophobin n=2 Tax=Moniliophthora roreri TaxID=221103 RepID=V2X4F0_MONRO|nr:hydrophobin 1 [Moniliophthora roreri MCA 2997]KAI3609642.1 hydrophobin 1 [Moniliophthora roreri]